jgi:hypothetical protein
MKLGASNQFGLRLRKMQRIRVKKKQKKKTTKKKKKNIGSIKYLTMHVKA